MECYPVQNRLKLLQGQALDFHGQGQNIWPQGQGQGQGQGQE